MNLTYDYKMFKETFESEFTWLNGFMRNVRRFGYKPAVISPVGELRYKDDVVVINDMKTGELTQKLYDTLTGIQWGRIEDKYNWIVPVE